MPDLRIFETDEFLARLDKMPPSVSRFLRRKPDEYVYPQLRQNPFFGTNIRKLRGYRPETWRYRVGRFRLFYSVDDEEGIVFILTVELRRDAYR